jgi:hypothetical protein
MRSKEAHARMGRIKFNMDLKKVLSLVDAPAATAKAFLRTCDSALFSKRFATELMNLLPILKALSSKRVHVSSISSLPPLLPQSIAPTASRRCGESKVASRGFAHAPQLRMLHP